MNLKKVKSRENKSCFGGVGTMAHAHRAPVNGGSSSGNGFWERILGAEKV
jgi:hypothetical protein